MSAHEKLVRALCGLPAKPPDDAQAHDKKRYSEQMSNVIAEAVSASLRTMGLDGARPGPQGDGGGSGAERRMAGGIGDKKVDVTWATEESGLILAFSIKCINFRDGRTRNFQKNFTNRRGDMLFEAVTLHRRFPYSSLIGLFVFDEGAKDDETRRRQPTLVNAHRGLKLFSGRADPAGRDEQYEKLYIGLVSASPQDSRIVFEEAGKERCPLDLDAVIGEALPVVSERNSDLYHFDGRRMRRV